MRVNNYDFGNEISEELKIVLDSIDSAICISDGKGVELWMNKTFEEFYQIDRSEIVGRCVTELENIGIYKPSLTKKILEQKKEMDMVHENKSGRKLMTRGHILRDKKGDITRVITNAVDITKLVALETELQDMQDKLLEYDLSSGIYLGDIVVKEPSMIDIIRLLDKLVNIDATILLTGESGTGKGALAKYIHQKGCRVKEPFVNINCGAIPENLIESELFGYTSGAFTGSSKAGKVGLFEVAQHGTVFLDEIGELPLNLQVKILQVLHEKEIKKIGGTESIPLDVRIIAATNADLQKLIKSGKFREDLYYRLNVVPIHIPPLRERPEDIILMAKTFLKKSNKKFNANKVLDPNTVTALLRYNWPGNVRELENIIERLVITVGNSIILSEHLPHYIYDFDKYQAKYTIEQGLSLKKALDTTEKEILVRALKKYKSSRKIAKALGVDKSTIIRKLKKHNIITNKE